MLKRRTISAGLAGLGLLTTSLLPTGPAQALETWPEPGWQGDPAPGPTSAYAAHDPGEMFGFDFTPDDCPETQRANQALGGVLGGVVGGLIGSGIGKGSGKTVATISGALLGAFGGAMLGNKVAEAGETCLPGPDYGHAGDDGRAPSDRPAPLF